MLALITVRKVGVFLIDLRKFKIIEYLSDNNLAQTTNASNAMEHKKQT